MENKKTQKQRLEELLSEMGVEFESEPNNVTVYGGGRAGSRCVFGFDRNGKLLSYGFWDL